MKSISFIHLMVSEKKIFSPKFTLLSPWQPIKFSDLDKSHIKGRGLLNKQISKNKFQISPLKLFHLSHFKSMENISYHSNKSSYPSEIKNTFYVEANVLSMYAKFQLYSPYGFREEFFKFFEILPFMSPWQPTKLSNLDKIHIERGGLYTINISVKTNFKYFN